MVTVVAMPKYEEYKDSGVEWLGAIPKYWEVKRLAAFGAFSKGGGFSKSDLIEKGVSAVLYGDIYTKYEYVIDCVERNISALAASNSVTIVKGDLLFTGSGETKEDIGKCVAYNGNDKVKAGGDILIFRQKDNNTLFLSYCLNTHGIVEEKAKSSKGEIIVHTYASKLKNLYIPIPTQLEQIAIANFLDKKTAQIDEAIAIKEKQIALLKERKQIIIQKAVTQGLNPNVPMKDSGMDWIGEIPEHWETMALRYAFEFKNSRRLPLSAIEREAKQGIYAYYGASGIIDYIDDYIFDENLILIAEDGANLLSKSTPLAFIASGKYWVNNHAHIIKPKFYGFKYWSELLSSLDYTVYISGATQPKLTRENLGSILVPVPPKNEIGAIIKHIELVAPNMDQAMGLQYEQIIKLKEYKITLINSAVTGKIKIEGHGYDA